MQQPITKTGRARLLPSRTLATLLFATGTILPLTPANAQSVIEKIDTAIESMATYNSGDPSDALELVHDLTITAQESDAASRVIAERLVTLLESNATVDARIFACKQLHLIGGDESVPALAKALNDPELAEIALYALDGIRTEAANNALRRAISSAPGELKPSIIQSIGERRDASSINTLNGLIYQRNDQVATAAIEALGKIGTPNAAQTIARARNGAPSNRRIQLTDALMVAAGHLLNEGDATRAKTYYNQLYNAAKDDATKVAAFKGLATASNDPSIVAEAVTSDSYQLAAAACEFVASHDANTEATNQYAALVEQTSPTIKPLLLSALAQRGDPSAVQAVRSALNANDAETKNAAINALARLGNAEDIPRLQTALANETTAEAAADALSRIAGSGVTEAIAQAAAEGQPEQRVQLIQVLGQRAQPSALPALMRFARDENAAIREAAYDACANAGTPETISDMVPLFVHEEDADARAAAERAVTQLANHDPKRAAIELSTWLRSAKKEPQTQAAILRAIATTHDPLALNALRDAAGSRDDTVRQAVVQSLAAWPNDKPLEDLRKLAKGKKDDPVRAEAFRAYIEMLRRRSDRTPAETANLFKSARKLAETNSDRQAWLAGLADVPHEDAIKLAERYLRDDELREEAKLAIQKIEKRSFQAIASHNAADAENAYDNNDRTRWSTGTVQRPGQWFQIDLGWTREVGAITLDSTGSSNDYPRAYEVFLSKNGQDWGDPVATGQGEQALTKITFKPTEARHIKITQTGQADQYHWSIHEFTVSE